MKVIKNYLWNVVYQIFIILVPIVTIPYLTRVLGPKGIGINSFTYSISQYFVLIASIGVALYGSRQIAYVRNDSVERSNTFWSIFILKLITTFVAIISYSIFIIIYSKYENYLWIQSLQILSAGLDISWYFMGIENFKVTVIRNVLIKILSVVLIFSFVKNQDDVIIYIFILGMSLVVGNLTLFPYLKYSISKINFKTINIFRHVLPALYLFVPQIAIQIYVVFNKTILGQMVSVDASGYYDNSDKIVRILLAVTTALGTVMLPHIANEFSKGNIERIKRLFYKSMDFVSLITIPMCFGLAAISYKFTILFFGRGFEEVAPLMFLESIAAVFMSYATAIGSQFLIPTNQTSKYTLAVIVGAVINIPGNFIFISLMGTNGAMVATIISEFCVSLCMLILVRKELNITDIYRYAPKYLVIGFVMFCVVHVFDGILNISWISIIFEILIGLFIYLILLIIVRPNLIYEIKNISKI